MINFHFCLASIVRSLSASLSLSHCTLSRRACARMSLWSWASRSWSWVARACERCCMSSHVVWVIHGCLGIAVSARTCVVHACWTASRSFVQEASTVVAGWAWNGRCAPESAWAWGCGVASPHCEVSALASKASCTAWLKALTTSSVAERSRFGVGGLRLEALVRRLV